MTTHTGRAVGHMDAPAKRGDAGKSREGQVKVARFVDPDVEVGEDWRERAECRPGNGHDTNLWFPIGESGPALLWIEEAKEICNTRCPVRDQCLAWALKANEAWGVWGGTSEADRRSMKRSAARARSRMA
jgi:WhiB family redox-sensing transcriptional regulator